MSRRLVVTFTGRPAVAFVRGHGSRELLTTLCGRPPFWAPDTRAWSVQEHTARDLIAVAEGHGYEVTVTGADLVDRPGADLTPRSDNTMSSADVELW